MAARLVFRADSASCERALADAIDSRLVQILHDRIVIDVHAVLVPGENRVHETGHAVLTALMQRWAETPAWSRIRIEGYSTRESNDLDNWRTSGRWAAAVRRLLVELGADPERVGSIGYGRLQDSGETKLRPPHRIELVFQSEP